MISLIKVSDIFYLSVVFIVIHVTQYYYRYFTRPNPLPGPFPLPILGNAHQQIGWDYGDWLMSLQKKYGDMFEINFPRDRVIVLCRTDLIENMNTSSTKTKYPFKFLITEGLMEYVDVGKNGSGILLNNDYKSWSYNRQFFSQAMLTPNFNHQAIEWTNDLWKEMEFYWNKLGENRELDLTTWIRRFTYETIFRITTGVKNNAVASHYYTLAPEKYDSLNEKEKEKIKESEDFMQSFGLFLDGLLCFAWYNKYIRNYVPFIREKMIGLSKNRDHFYDKLYNIINERRNEIENTPLDQPLRHDMLTSYITANTLRDINNTKRADADLLRPMTDKEILDNIIEAVTAGIDTTTNFFCFIVYYLGHYPEVKQRLQQELDKVFGKDLTKPITSKDLDELQYCDSVIKEVTRHVPAAFVISRMNAEKDEVGGLIWPEKTAFNILYSAMFKSQNYWTNPEKFDPDRFYKIEESDKYLLEKQHAKNAFTFFGNGIRMCPGRKLAMIELKSFLASIYRKYDIELTDMNAPLKYENVFFFPVCKELKVKVKQRKF